MKRFRALTIGMIALVSLVAFEAVAITTAMPTVARALDGLPLYALAFGGPLAASVVAMVLAGGWCDTRGPAAPTLTGVVLFSAGLLLAGLAGNMWILVAGRIVQGFGGGLIGVAVYVIVGRVYPTELHARVFAAFAGAWVLPAVLGPTIAGLIVEHLQWRWVFLSVVFASVPAAALVWPRVRTIGPPAATGPRTGRTPWAVGAAASVGLLDFGGQLTGADAALLLGGGAVGLVLCTPRLLPPGTFAARRGLPSVVLLRGLAGAAFLQTEVFIPLMLTSERGFSPAGAGLTVTVSSVSWSLGSWYQSRRGQRIAAEVRLRIGLALIAVGVLSAMAVAVPVVPVAVVIVGWAFSGFGMGIMYPVTSTLVLQFSPAREQGANSSALQVSDALQTTTALALSGALFALLVRSSAPLAYLAGYGLALLLAIAGVLVAGRTKAVDLGDSPPSGGPKVAKVNNSVGGVLPADVDQNMAPFARTV